MTNIRFSLKVLVLTITMLSGSSLLAKPAKLMICAACHGNDGIGTNDLYPNLNGQKKKYLIKQMKDFKSGKRKDASMKPMVQSLTDKDIEELAAYYSKLK